MFVLAFTAGIISFISPCIVPMITVYFGVITGIPADELKKTGKGYKRQIGILVNTILFILAFTLVFTVAGGVAGETAKFINMNINIFNMVGGVAVILLSLNMLGIAGFNLINMPKLENFLSRVKTSTHAKYITTFFVGVFFAVACSHCIGPILYSMLIFAGSTGSIYGGMLVMFMFSMGLAIPFLMAGLFMGRIINLLQKTAKRTKTISIIMGIIMLIFGILMLLNKFTLLVQLFSKIIPLKLPLGM
ncbi:MAG: cytochrome C biogenesis protein [Ruminiclostridium sp.]|nr:cytochrome C biogenesis protein [Ruminiclostridium sp.]